MSTIDPDDLEDGLPPPGSRWGSGAHSVLPYLAKTLQSRPANPAEHAREARQPREREPRQHERESHPEFRQAGSARH